METALLIKCLQRRTICTSCHHDNILDKVVSLTSNENAAGVVEMILLGPTSTELTFSALDISCSICL